MDLGLTGKRALVTGSTAGIGLATAEALAREGAHIVINGRTQRRVDEALARLRSLSGARIEGLAADVGGAEGCGKVIAAYPELDILVNNMGIFEPKPFEEITDAEVLRRPKVSAVSSPSSPPRAVKRWRRSRKTSSTTRAPPP